MNNLRRTGISLASALLGASILAACGSGSADTSGGGASTSPSASEAASSTPSSGGSSSAAKTAKIMIMNFAFSGASSVPAGTKITVTNMDKEAHTVTADSGGAFDVNVPAGGTATWTAPSKPGTYAYHCNFHSNMHGTLKVG